jgi:hypothetical protein
MKKPTRPAIYGVMAEFDDVTAAVTAAERVHAEGYRHIDAYSPYPVEALSEAIGFHKNSLPLIVLIGGILGMIGGYALQYYVSVINYPLNVGGKPCIAGRPTSRSLSRRRCSARRSRRSSECSP